MMQRLFPPHAMLLLGLSLIILGGCTGTSQPSRFYMLQVLPHPETEQKVAAAEEGLTIGVGPVELPEYLDRPQIVTRAGGSELKLAEFDKWAGSLKDDLPRVLAENLSILLSTDQVAVYPWRGSTRVQYQVAVDVIRFEGKLGESVSLVARWVIFGEGGRKVILMRKSDLSEPMDGASYDAMVSAQSRALAEFSREIAQAIKGFSK